MNAVIEIGYGKAGQAPQAVLTLNGETVDSEAIAYDSNGSAKVTLTTGTRAFSEGDALTLTVTDGDEVMLTKAIGYSDPAKTVDILLVAGQSNALGQEGNAEESLKPEAGTVYYQTMGNTMLSDSGNKGWDSALGKRWHELTGHTVLVVKAAWGGTGFPTKANMDTGAVSTSGSDRYGRWDPDYSGSVRNCYTSAKTLYNTAVASIDTNTYKIGSRVYFWNQGENENNSYTAAEYEAAFMELHNRLTTELGTESTRLEYGGILPVRSSYNDGFPNLKLTGPRIAQYKMAGERDDLMVVMDATEHWYSDASIASWFTEEYSGREYPLAAMPDAWSDIMQGDKVHYTQAAMNEFGTEAAENMLACLANADNTKALGGIDLITPSGIVHYSEGEDIVLPAISADAYTCTTEGVIPVVPASSGVRATFSLTGNAATMDENGVITANEALSGDYSILTVAVNGTEVMRFKVYSPLVDETVSIAAVKDNKKAIYTLTTDDNYRYTNYEYLNGKILALGLKATMGLVVDWMNDAANTNSGRLTWEEAQALVAGGSWGVANQTLNHKQSAFKTLTEAELKEEINGARAILKTYFPDEKIVGLYTPGGASSELIKSVAKEEHLSLRLAGGGSNSLPKTESGMYSLACYGVHNKDAATLNGYVDAAISGGAWLVEMWHGVGDTDAADWKGNITTENANAHLSYVAEKKADLWITTLDEASVYAMHRLKARLSLTAKGADSLTFTLTDDLSEEIYGDSCLTLNIELPDGWEGAGVTHGGKAVSHVDNGDGSISITINANGGDIVVSRA